MRWKWFVAVGVLIILIAGQNLIDSETHVIHFAPPLVIIKEQVEWAVEKIGDVITS